MADNAFQQQQQLRHSTNSGSSTHISVVHFVTPILGPGIPLAGMPRLDCYMG